MQWLGFIILVTAIPALALAALRFTYLTVRVRWRLEELKFEQYEAMTDSSFTSDRIWYRMLWDEDYERIPDARIVAWARSARTCFMIMIFAMALLVPVILI